MFCADAPMWRPLVVLRSVCWACFLDIHQAAVSVAGSHECPSPRLMLWYAAHINKLLCVLPRSRRCGVVFAAVARAPENRWTTSRTVKRDDSIDVTYRFAVR
jgi:hypothetical protein